ncbi:VWA domain-containing protein [Nocardia sp. NBC_00508]|uniref:vWA domain-containing protein n=1 Tax=Nocardia sp. NBC_00508 TaxID=2975992 RepID=UPI002E81E979|nr:VWA domain-containing protein [Nocardia sp. NBC_00508]WUD66195.1 VWA domain-containing protein [Nocardia sp. NBC_00508]
MTRAVLLRGVDLAAFAVAMVARLRRGGVAVAPSGPALYVQALRRMTPRSRTELYWATRLTLVDRMQDLAAFDAVFATVFADATLGMDPPSRTHGLPAQRVSAPGAGRRGQPRQGGEAPWATMQSATGADRSTDKGAALPDVLPSRFAARAQEPFARFEPDDLRTVGAWLEQAAALWPQRRSTRYENHAHGKRIDFRATMNNSRRTGWESAVLVRTRPRRRPRRIVMICDVSRSMQPYATIYLHLMRAAMQRRSPDRPEVFAFSTSLTRLTSVLAHRSPDVAVARANDKVTDRYGGTHIGRCLGALLATPSGNAVRGAVVVIASDGWDSDTPDLLARAMARIRRRAWRVIWLNPRAGESRFQPVTGAMAAALPFCDVMMPAHTMAGIHAFVQVLASSVVT